MIFIGITGGVGAGKSEILNHILTKEGTRVMLADEIAHELMEPGQEAYLEICKVFADEDIFMKDNPAFDRGKLAQVIFSDDNKRKKLNAIVHPAVKNYVRKQYQLEKERGTIQVLVLEAALLIEGHFDEICDELWYIYTSEENRRARLKASRGYSDEKIDGIFKSQLQEEEFRKATQVVIDNNNTVEETFRQIDNALEDALRRYEHE